MSTSPLTSNPPSHRYSLEAARAFHWGSVTGQLNPERKALLDECLVGNRILDAGCGGGAYANYVAALGHEVTGIDLHNEFLSICSNGEGGAEFLQADIARLPFPDASFDCAYCCDVLEHVDDTRALAELRRVTRQRIILAVPRRDEIMTRYGLTFFHYQDPTHLRTYTEESLSELIGTISPHSYEIRPELAVALIPLVRELVIGPGHNSGMFATMRRRFIQLLLAAATPQTVHSGLTAIVDLE